MATPATLAEALVEFQKNAPHIAKDSINPHFKNKYASLDTIMDAVRVPLATVGLALSQHPTSENGFPGLRTILLHASGERLEDVMLLSADKPGPQAQGSALTYARRYAVLAVLGLVADEDDDANAAEKPKQAASKPAAKPAAASGADSSLPSEDGLTASLLAAAEKMAAAEGRAELPVQVEQAIAKSKETRTPEEHVAWLRRSLATAEENPKVSA